MAQAIPPGANAVSCGLVAMARARLFRHLPFRFQGDELVGSPGRLVRLSQCQPIRRYPVGVRHTGPLLASTRAAMYAEERGMLRLSRSSTKQTPNDAEGIYP